LRDPISIKPTQKRAGGVAQGVDPEFKPQYHKKKKKEKETALQAVNSKNADTHTISILDPQILPTLETTAD
jgi:hypothetical protein